MKQHRHTCSLGTRLEHLQVWLPPRRCLEHLPTRKETRFVSKWQLMKTQNGVKMFQDDWWCFWQLSLTLSWARCEFSSPVGPRKQCYMLPHGAYMGKISCHIIPYHNSKKMFQKNSEDDRRWPRFILIVTRSDDISCVTTKCKLDTVTSLKCWQNI